MEELSPELIKKFNQDELRPYLKGVYADLLLRSSPAKDQKTCTQVDKVTFIEYINLPGILSERFFSLTCPCGSAQKVDSRVLPDKFINTISTVYCSSLEDKMQLVFQLFDFDLDGRISADDVRLVMNYIPFRRCKRSTLSLDSESKVAKKKS